MKLVVNGEPREVEGAATLHDLLLVLGIDPQRVAVEVDREVVPRVRHAQFPLREGAQVEIVSFVGGGR